MMKSRAEIRACIRGVLIPYFDCIAWEDFSDAGNSCYDPYAFASKEEEEETVLTLAAVLLEMPKYSRIHAELARKVADMLGNKWVTYPWLVKAVSRIIAGATYPELLSMAMRSRKVRDGMKA